MKLPARRLVRPSLDIYYIGLRYDMSGIPDIQAGQLVTCRPTRWGLSVQISGTDAAVTVRAAAGGRP